MTASLGCDTCGLSNNTT